ncbi:MAG: AAA family ATPase [Gammaproteobacteria bacterium]
MKLLDYEMPKVTAVQVDLDVLVLAGSDTSAAALHQVLAEMPRISHSLVRSTSSHPLQDDTSDALADVVILDLQRVDETCLDDIRRFIKQRGDEMELFVTLQRPDTQTVKQLLQAGAADIIGQAFDPAEIQRALDGTRERLLQAANRPGPARYEVMAFMPTHPSAGGGFLASNIAWQLASLAGRNAVLVDLDIQFGTAASELDIKPGSGLIEALKYPERIDKVFLDALITRHPSGLRVLASPGDLSPSELLNRKAVARLISVLGETHDHVVINLPLFVNDAVEQVLRQVNPLFLVTQGGLSALRNLRMILDYLVHHGLAETEREIVHLEGPVSDEKANTELLKKLAGNAPVHSVRQDPQLLFKADNEGRAASDLDPRAELVKDIRRMAARIAGQESSNNAARKRGLLHWFN